MPHPSRSRPGAARSSCTTDQATSLLYSLDALEDIDWETVELDELTITREDSDYEVEYESGNGVRRAKRGMIGVQALPLEDEINVVGEHDESDVVGEYVESDVGDLISFATEEKETCFSAHNESLLCAHNKDTHVGVSDTIFKNNEDNETYLDYENKENIDSNIRKKCGNAGGMVIPSWTRKNEEISVNTPTKENSDPNVSKKSYIVNSSGKDFSGSALSSSDFASNNIGGYDEISLGDQNWVNSTPIKRCNNLDLLNTKERDISVSEIRSSEFISNTNEDYAVSVGTESSTPNKSVTNFDNK